MSTPDHLTTRALPPTTPVGGILTLISVFLLFLLYFTCIAAGVFLLCGPPILPFLLRLMVLVLALVGAVLDYIGAIIDCILVFIASQPLHRLVAWIQQLLQMVLAWILQALLLVLYEIPVAIMVWVMATVVTFLKSPRTVMQDFGGFVFAGISFILAFVKLVLEYGLSLAEELVNAIAHPSTTIIAMNFSALFFWAGIILISILNVVVSLPMPPTVNGGTCFGSCFGVFDSGYSDATTPPGTPHHLSSLSSDCGDTSDYRDSTDSLLLLSPRPMRSDEYIEVVSLEEWQRENHWKKKMLRQFADLWRKTKDVRHKVVGWFVKAWNWFLDKIWNSRVELKKKINHNHTEEFKRRKAALLAQINEERRAQGYTPTHMGNYGPTCGGASGSSGCTRGGTIPSEIQGDRFIEDAPSDWKYLMSGGQGNGNGDDGPSIKTKHRQPPPRTPPNGPEYHRDDDHDPDFGAMPIEAVIRTSGENSPIAPKNIADEEELVRMLSRRIMKAAANPEKARPAEQGSSGPKPSSQQPYTGKPPTARIPKIKVYGN
ncbi:hypothetical protein DFH27DRAFT_610431 [Peziza echinospora]|nr:hypothetical protein DFH27DRAFT_610431 [Peziza echinospora]